MLSAGGIIAYPTEAVWGLGCDPQNPAAFARLRALKSRAEAKGVILIAADSRQLQPYLGHLTAEQQRRLAAAATVPTTWIVPAGPAARPWLTGGRPTLAVRITGHPLAAELCRAFGGPIVSTSANRGGKAPARSALRVRCYFPGSAVLLVPGALGGAAKPSEIRDLATGNILRAGT